MKVLQLVLRKETFDSILSGEQKSEVREIRPNASFSKYAICVDVNGKTYKSENLVPDDVDYEVVPVKYDAIQFYHGYETDRRSMLIEVKDAMVYMLTDDDGKDLTYELDGKEYIYSEIEYSLGKILNKTNC
ncbi:ASCH domain-containing protein [Dysgonomonas sp. 521]|uniref:ASCH domain-containing protein n=1 Tax=Dysgonomonas sp. 521 TaxID=2302932 RepID=UPI0013D081B7|nr:ASCH domain-containing protein [Dysgonomonas sp. 521]NDV93477.1 ASCH domain-containing protein [Dysgonomonas sp. 521]